MVQVLRFLGLTLNQVYQKKTIQTGEEISLEMTLSVQTTRPKDNYILAFEQTNGKFILK